MNLQADGLAALSGFAASLIAEGLNLFRTRQKQAYTYRMVQAGCKLEDLEQQSVSRSKSETAIYLFTSSSATIVCYLILSIYILNKSHTIFSQSESFFNELDTAAFLAVLSYQLGASALKSK